MTTTTRSTIAVALTGASGVPIAYRLIECLLRAGRNIAVVYSKAAQTVSMEETNLFLSESPEETRERLCLYFKVTADRLVVYHREDWHSPLASGSSCPDAMVICPASMGTVATIAHGLSDNLLTRAADVMIKEKKNLIVVPRESPLSSLHLANLTTVAQYAVIIAPMLTFYQRPMNITDMIDAVVSRILDHLNISNEITARWEKV